MTTTSKTIQIQEADESHNVGWKLGLHPFFLDSLGSVAVYRYESGRCHYFLPFLTYFFFVFSPFQFSFYFYTIEQNTSTSDI